MNGSATVSGTVYGGYTNVANGKATGNEVTIEKAIMGNVVGGSGTSTNNNRINLRNATVSGTVTGGTAANGTGNTLAVYYGTGTTSIGNFSGIQNLHFDLENTPTSNTNPLLKITMLPAKRAFRISILLFIAVVQRRNSRRATRSPSRRMRRWAAQPALVTM